MSNRRLELPDDVISDDQAFELATVWFSNNKVKIITGTGTGLEQDPAMWGKILAGVAENAALSIEKQNQRSSSEILSIIKESLDRNWR